MTAPGSRQHFQLYSGKKIQIENAARTAYLDVIGLDSNDLITLGQSLGSQTLGAGANLVLDSTSGTKIGTATTQKLGFFNSTPIVQPASTTDIRTVLINLGLLATGGASPLNLNGGTLTAGSVVSSGTITFNTAALTLTSGSGAPGGSAPLGSIYVRTDGSGVANRLYINTNGTTGWTNFVTAA